MPILDVQRRVAIIGHIRLGERITQGNVERPRALTGFRFTSTRKQLIEIAAERYGGTCQPWHNPSTNIDGYEVLTTTSELPVLVPPADVAFSQHYELWSGSGCERRCDGFTESRGNEPQPCVCATEGVRSCVAVTRLSLLLPDLATVFGVWQLVTHSYYASGELASAVELALGMAARRAEHLASATLRLEQRVARRVGERPHRYTVPLLDVELDLRALAASPAQATRPELENPPNGNVEALASLSVIGLPEPNPRIDRGQPSPAPHELDDEGATAPTITLTHTEQGYEVPEHEGELALERGGIAFERVDEVPPEAEQSQPMREAFARIKDVWPDLDLTERDRRRAALAIVASIKREQPVSSWADLNPNELLMLCNTLHRIKARAMTMEPTTGGYRFTLPDGRALVVIKHAISGNYELQHHKTREDDDARPF